MTKSNKRQPSSKRTNMPRDSRKSKSFVKDWEKLSHSGKQDLNILKEAMLLLIANDEPLPPEWKDHQLSGNLKEFRECHVKGDLLLVYQIEKSGPDELVIFTEAKTHSEMF